MVRISTRWRKVWRDLWLNKARTVLVVLSIAVGVFALGTIVTSRTTLSRDLSQSYREINPSSGMIMTVDPFGDDLVEVIRRMREVGEAEGRRNTLARIQVGPEEWRDLQLIAIADYDDMRINKVWPESGAWPPPEREMLIERAALPLTNAEVGDTVRVKAPSGKQKELRIAGLTHDLSRMPAVFDGTIYAYVTYDTLEWLGESRDYNELHFIVAENYDDKKHAEEVARKIQDKIEKSGRAVFFALVYNPGQHPLHDSIQTMLLILGVLGFLSLGLSGFLVVNIISALLAQQVRQIGIMKAIGARRRQIVAMYLGMVLIFGLLSLVIAVPMGAVGASLFTQFIAGLFNFNLSRFSIPAGVFALQMAVGLMVPVLAALYPVMAGTRVTAREAMSDYGLGKGDFGRGIVDRVLERVKGLSRPVLLSLRNTFRRKGRLALTLMALIMGGAIFIAVFSVRDSLLQTLDELLGVWQYDVWVIFSRAYRVTEVEQETLLVPGAVAAEAADFITTRRVRPDDTESEQLFLLAPQPGSELVKPLIVEGRWLVPEDENAIVLTTNFVKNEPDLGVGSEMVLKIGGKETSWKIVGVFKWLGPFGYVNYPYLARVAGDMGRTRGLWVVTEEHDVETQKAVARELERHFERSGLNVSSITQIAQERAEVEMSFNVIVALLLIMAVLLAVVGGLGLMGTMSINVLERTREIGVMRAIGASDGAVVQVFVVEGMVIGALSWLVGAVVAFPLSKILSDTVGMVFMQSPLSYTFSVGGVLLWLVVIVVLAALASYLPARGAARLTVREILAYE